MPKKNGIQVVQEVRDIYKNKAQLYPAIKLELPVFVFLTAFSTVHFKKHMASLGIRNIFEKPIQVEQLKMLIEQDAPSKPQDWSNLLLK